MAARFGCSPITHPFQRKRSTEPSRAKSSSTISGASRGTVLAAPSHSGQMEIHSADSSADRGRKKVTAYPALARTVQGCPEKRVSLYPVAPPGTDAKLCYSLNSSVNGRVAERPGGAKCSDGSGHDLRPARHNPPESGTLYCTKQIDSTSRNQAAACYQ